MARLSRVVASGIPHHVTQRGNAQRPVFETDSDRLVYLDLLQLNCRLQGLSVAGYCLMSNHVHLIVIPALPSSLPVALKLTHGRYGAYLNARQSSSGHVWQGRYYSCPLDTPHFWAALRYTELNPVRAGIVRSPEDYYWSSAPAHCLDDPADRVLNLQPWQAEWNPASWREFLKAGVADTEAQAIRGSTHTGRPLGRPEFVTYLESRLHRRLAAARGGRPMGRQIDDREVALDFGEAQI